MNTTIRKPTVLLFYSVTLWQASLAFAITIDTVPVGNAGNVGDPQIAHPFGAVAYEYRIGRTEVTDSQYAAFLNAVAATDTYDLYNVNMGSVVPGGITRSGNPGSYSYNVKPGYDNLPVSFVSWGDSARFANWLQNGQPGLGGPAVPQNAASTEDGAYTLNGAISSAALNAVTRNAGATIFIPSENEWYKAAYYNPSTSSYFQYPTSSNTTPSNAYVDAGNNANFGNRSGYTTTSPYLTDVGHFSMSASPYGTFDQGGNVWEWNEAFISGSFRGLRGGTYNTTVDASLYLNASYRAFDNPTDEWIDIGFRVASVPEPAALTQATLGFLALFALWNRRWVNRAPRVWSALDHKSRRPASPQRK